MWFDIASTAAKACSDGCGEEALSRWHTVLDYLGAALAAGVQVDSRIAFKAGIQITAVAASPTI